MAIERISFPSVVLGTLGTTVRTSWWVAANNPIPVQLRRRDFTVHSIGLPNRIYINYTPSFDIQAGDRIYLQCQNGARIFEVSGVFNNGSGWRVEVDGTISTSLGNGVFVNNYGRQGYHVAVKMYFPDLINPTTGAPYYTSSRYSNQEDGTIEIDLSGMVKARMQKVNNHPYTALLINYKDTDIYKRFYVTIQEGWDGSNNSEYGLVENGISPAQDKIWFGINAGNQTAYANGCNMAEYVVWNSLNSSAKWLTKFERPTWWVDYPMDMAIIIGDGNSSIPYVDMQRVIRGFDRNGNQLGITAKQTLVKSKFNAVNRIDLSTPTTTTPDYIELHLTMSGAAPVTYFNEGYVTDGYLQSAPAPGFTLDEVTERILIDVKYCQDRPLYLCWLNTLGGWDYWMFQHNQMEELTTSDSERFRPHVTDVALINSRDDYYSRKAVKRLTIGADNLTRQQMVGLKDLLTSLKVYEMQQDGTRTTVLVLDGSFDMDETRNDRFSVELEIEYPEKYLQEG